MRKIQSRIQTAKKGDNSTELRTKYIALHNHLFELLEAQDMRTVFKALYHTNLNNPVLLEFLRKNAK